MPTLVALLILTFSTCAVARDLGQWGNTDPAISAWFRSLMQPDKPWISCCGEGDAYWADASEVEHGNTIAIITDNRDDTPLSRPHEDIGTRYVVPPNKIKYDKGNPTGHVVIFLGGKVWSSTRDLMMPREVLCYVMGSGV